MNVPVQVQAWLENFEQPDEGIDTFMGTIGHIVNAGRRRVGNKYIERSASQPAIEKKPRGQSKHVSPHFLLRILKGSPIVAQRAFNPGKDETLVLNDFPMEIYGAIGFGLCAGLAVFDRICMVASDKKDLFAELILDIL